METTFTFTATKGNGQKYEVRCGESVRAHLTQEQLDGILDLGCKVYWQNKKQSLLRTANGPEDAVEVMQGFGFKDVEVVPYVERAKTKKAITLDDVKEFIRKQGLTEDEIIALATEAE